MLRQFEYVGPAKIRDDAQGAPPGVRIADREAVLSWLADSATGNADENGWATYVVDLRGDLVIAPRRTEHVACAQGRAVLAAGEIRFGMQGDVLEVTNLSTGYCPSEGRDIHVRVATALRKTLLEAGLLTSDGLVFATEFCQSDWQENTRASNPPDACAAHRV